MFIFILKNVNSKMGKALSFYYLYLCCTNKIKIRRLIPKITKKDE
jgi:hypothetical protein